MANKSLTATAEQAKELYAQATVIRRLFSTSSKYDTVLEIAEQLKEDKTKFVSMLDIVDLQTLELFNWESIEQDSKSPKLKKLAANSGFPLAQYLSDNDVEVFIGATVGTLKLKQLPKTIKENEVVYEEVYNLDESINTLKFVGFLQELYDEFVDVDEEDIIDLLNVDDESFEQSPGMLVFGISADKEHVDSLYAELKEKLRKE